ncbi:hypothetical protein GGX14DRAFT_377816, partial [Mycena pura]
TGLDLTVCNHIILVDMWWNPSVEDQAFDRTHRIGQTRDVHIYKLKIDNMLRTGCWRYGASFTFTEIIRPNTMLAAREETRIDEGVS